MEGLRDKKELRRTFLEKRRHIDPKINEHLDKKIAENLFEKDSFNMALNGDGNAPGFLEIIDKYSSTPSGNLANYYAGICYLHLGDNKNAIKHLEKFSSDDVIFSSMVTANLGDAYMQLGDFKKASSNYQAIPERPICGCRARFVRSNSSHVLVYPAIPDFFAPIRLDYQKCGYYPRRILRACKTSKNAPYNQIRRIRLFSKKNPLIRADFFMLFTPS